MRGRYHFHAQSGASRIVNFRRRWANKSDTAIKAVLNYFWSRQTDRSSTAIQKDRLRK
jgi:hypothetical protein